MAKSPKFTESGIMEPEARFKHLASFGNSVAVDPNIPAVRYSNHKLTVTQRGSINYSWGFLFLTIWSFRRYYRSGTEMERMAKVYLSEGNLEDAYILYLRFSTLFIEKIISHPEYKAVPATMKQLNKARLKDILNILEQVKGKLLERYKREYANFLVNKETERLRALELEKVREEEQRRRIPRDIPAVAPAPPPSGFNDFTPYDVPPSAPSAAELLDNIVYPNDFPSDKNRSPSARLILPGGGTGEAAKRPTVDRTLKPSASYTGGLRMVVVPKDTMYRFLLLVAENTAKNIETCGILAGKLSQNRFRLTHVIIPKQRGTSDSCNTMNEEELFDVQDQHNLITLGWIHVSFILNSHFLYTNVRLLPA